VHDLVAQIKSAAASVLNAVTVEGALRTALELLSEGMEWPIGHALLIDGTRQEMVSTGIWYDAEPAAHAEFRRVTESSRFGPDVGLPGMILANGQPLWIDDLSKFRSVPRTTVAARAGIYAALAFPIIGSYGIEGVVELFGSEPRARDPGALDLLAVLGLHLGGVIDRIRAGAALEGTQRAGEARLAEAHRIARIGTFSWDVGSDSILWSAELKRLFGLEPEDGPVQFADYARLLHPDDRERVTGRVLQSVDDLQSFEHDYRILHASGSIRWMHARGDVAESHDGRAVRLVGYCRDITEQRRAEERRNTAIADLSDYQRVLEGVARGEDLSITLESLCLEVEKRMEGAACSILLVDDEDRTLRTAASPSVPRGYTEALDGLPIVRGLGACGNAAATGQVCIVEDVRRDPLTAPFVDLADEFDLRSVWSYPLKSGAGTVVGTFAIYRKEPHRPDEAEMATAKVAGDLASLAIERHQASEALTAAAQVDPLTGLPNRARFLLELQQQLDRRKGFVAVMFVDLDRFKWINDSLGHPVGDGILVEAARRIQESMPATSFVSRFGGDEFTIILPTASPVRVNAAVTDLERAFDAPFLLDGGEFFLSISVGICTNDRPSGAFEMVRDADAAMYAAKERGRARHVWFDDGLRQRALDRLSLESKLRRALERDEFVMHYQPVVHLGTGAWAGAESLVRWNHPGDGMIGPNQFIPLSEETGLILPLGELIFEKVLDDAKRAGHPEIWPIAVNISPIQLSDPSMASWLARTAEEAGVPTDRIILELTESSLMEEFERALPVLQQLAEAGFSLVIDDFGTGHSSIARLIEMPVKGIKIDRSFISRLGDDPAAERVVAAIVDLAHALGLRVVSEGVETAHALSRLGTLGSDLAQGFFIARPMPVAELTALFGGPPPGC
jgi:c-di-GMP-specific phosphodiesterase